MTRFAVGLMSGTSLDGVDAALIEATGAGETLRARVLGHVEAGLGEAAGTLRAAAEGEALPAIDFLRAGRALGEAYAGAAAACVQRFLPAGATLTLAAAHGQTVCHAPEEGLSWQLFDPGPLAERLNVPVVWDLRQADLLAGGQGAPITPLADAALYPDERPLLVVNLGGVVNVTALPGAGGAGGEPWGGDVCACNLLLDGLVTRRVPGARFDDGGELAAAGWADPEAVAAIRGGPGFAHAAGRTLGREQVPAAWLDGLAAGPARTGDLLAAAARAIAESVAAAAADRRPGPVVLAGGGVRNAGLVAALRAAMPGREVRASDEPGVPAQAREAAGMAVLGLRALDRAPTCLPGVTGARRATVGGRWCHPAAPAPAPVAPRSDPATPPSERPLADGDRLDAMGTAELLGFLHARDREAVAAVTPALPALATLVDRAVEAINAGGRLVYLGAGTSGRLGVLDASELPPTFSEDPARVPAFIAGGDGALRRSVEGAEDDPAGAAAWLDGLGVGAGDVVLGIAASGHTPVVRGGLAHAAAAGAATALLACVPEEALEPAEGVDLLVCLDTGGEAVRGSTRMKAGTATKLALNLLSTAVMVRRGKVWGGWMVDVKASNEKLRRRALRILREAGGVPAGEAPALLAAAGGRVKLALAMHGLGLGAGEAEARLEEHGGHLRPLLGDPPGWRQ